MVNAQYCNSFAMTKGMVLGYENLDSKGKVTVKSSTTCLDLNTLGSGAIIYSVKTTISDAKDVPVSYREYDIKCEDGKFNIMMGSFTDPEKMKEYDDLYIFIDTIGMVYPAKLSVGQNLPDASFSISKAELGAIMKTYDAKVTNRKVVNIESVSVPAGTFECFKITYDLQVKGLFKKKYEIVEYVSEGIGKIKTENFNKKGMLKSSSQLVELKK